MCINNKTIDDKERVGNFFQELFFFMHEIIRKSKTAEKQKMLKREKEKFENKLSDKDLFRHLKKQERQ